MRFLKAHGLKLLLAAGIAGAVALIIHVGPQTVLETLLRAGPWLPLIMLLEAAVFATDAWALTMFYDQHATRVPVRHWIRASLIHYAAMVALPAGRAGAEATRAAMLSKFVGGPRSSAGALQVQSVTLLANTFISFVCWGAVVSVSGFGSVLGWLLLGNGALTGVLGAGLYLTMHRLNVGGWLGCRLKALNEHGPEVDRIFREAPSVPLRAVSVCCLGRAMQAVQYGIILIAVGGTASPVAALVSEGIHLVGAGLGDLVPNQAGITEAAYGLFSNALGISAAAGVSIALLARINQFSLAGLAFMVGSVLGAQPYTEEPVGQRAAE